MIIRPATEEHVESWVGLRSALWPSAQRADHRRDIERTFFRDTGSTIAFVALAGNDMIGFAEASLRHDYVNGCKTSPVAFLEGIYVAPASAVRVSQQHSARPWKIGGDKPGCPDFASDTSPENFDSQRLHVSLGFEETQRVIFFRKLLT